nr:hypothetical protein [Tanacetum cinerariifolium]
MAEFLRLPNFQGYKVAAGTLLLPRTARVTHSTPATDRLEDIPLKTGDMVVVELLYRKVFAGKEKKKKKAEAKAAAKADDSDQAKKVVRKKHAREEGTYRKKKRRHTRRTLPLI